MTAAQAAVLAVVDARGAGFLATRTDRTYALVHAGAARALVRSGVLVEFLASDGTFVRRAPEIVEVGPAPCICPHGCGEDGPTG